MNIDVCKLYNAQNANFACLGWNRNERILLCTPLRDASEHLDNFFSLLVNLTYPHQLIDLAFLVSDSADGTLPLLVSLLDQIQKSDPRTNVRFGQVSILEKDFGQDASESFSDRHSFEKQGPRRKLMARARNYLIRNTLRPYHSWVYWRDVDLQYAPPTIIEDLMKHNKDVIVPNVWRPLPDWLGNEQPYDLNSWIESKDGIKLASNLKEDDIIVEGYSEYRTWRTHLAFLRDRLGDPNTEVKLDGVGGVSLLCKARVFRLGAHFPAFAYKNHAETEGFGLMARDMGLSVVGLPNYVIWHMYEPTMEDIQYIMNIDQEQLTLEKKLLEERVSREKDN